MKRALVLLNGISAFVVLAWSFFAIFQHYGSSFSLYCDLVRRGIIDEKSLTSAAAEQQAHDVMIQIARFGGIHANCAGIAAFAAAVFLVNIVLVVQLTRKSTGQA